MSDADKTKGALMFIIVMDYLKKNNLEVYKEELRRMLDNEHHTKEFIDEYCRMYPKWTTCGEFDE